MVMERESSLDGEHTVQYTDDVRTRETYIILLTGVTNKFNRI